MKKKLVVILSVAVSIVIVAAAVFTSLYFVLWKNEEEDTEFKLHLNPIDPWDMGVEERLEDFNYFYELIKENYPYLVLKERTHGYNWLDLKNYYEERIRNAEGNQEFLEILLDAINALQNLHTHLVPPDQIAFWEYLYDSYYPWNETFCQEVQFANIYWKSKYYALIWESQFSFFDASIVYEKGEYTITDGSGNWAERYGNRSIILSVNGVAIDEAIKTCYETAYLDYDFVRNKTFLWDIGPSAFGAGAEFTLRNTTGHEKTVTFTEGVYSYDPWGYPAQRIYTDLLRNETIAYLHIQDFWLEHIDEDFSFLRNFYEQIEQCDYLIIDIRGNQGGTTGYWHYIVQQLAKRSYNFETYLAFRTGKHVQYFREGAGIETAVSKGGFSYLPPEVKTDQFDLYNTTQVIEPSSSGLNFDGEIILLTDGRVYSAAENFAVFCKTTGFATIYGTATGGDGIGFDPCFYVLPNSKLVIRFSCVMGLDFTGHANEEVRTQPDFLYESALGNWTELIDYVCNNLP